MERWNSPCLAYETHVNTDFYTRTVTKWTRCRELIVLSHKWHFARIPFHCLLFLLFVYFLLRQVGILLHVLEEMQTQVRAAYSGTTLCWSQSFSKWRKWLLRSQTPAVCRGNPFPLHTHTHSHLQNLLRLGPWHHLLIKTWESLPFWEKLLNRRSRNS